MKLLFISLNQQDAKEFKDVPTDISAIGIRYLSSYLKKIGHEVNILFLCKYHSDMEDDQEINQIIELIKNTNPDLIGLGLMSNHFFRAVKITQAIKKNYSLPIIWGGIHPTINPIECLKYSDLVCVGEGELAMEKLLNNLSDYKTVNLNGIWYKSGDEIVKNGYGNLIPSINGLPYPDYDLKNQYIIHQGKLISLSVDILKQYFPAYRGDHRLISSRGCPHNCTYCCSSVFKNFYGHGYLRLRSVEDFMGELMLIKNKFSFIKSFKIMDDSFAVNNIEWMSEFNKQYKEKINLPFFCNVSPLTINEPKLDLLIDAGLKFVQIGLQSGSDRINNDIYLRPMKVGNFLKAAQLFEKYKNRLNLTVDVIVDNPYEKDEDLIKTIDVLTQIKKPFNLSMFSLAIYPGTGLYNKASADKLISNEDEYLNKQYQSLKNNILNKVIYLSSRLSKQKIDYLVDNYNEFITRLYILLMYFIYTKKNKFPPIILKLYSKFK